MFSSNDDNFGYCHSDDYNSSDDNCKSDSYDNIFMIIIMIIVVIISVVAFTLALKNKLGYVKLLES